VAHHIRRHGTRPAFGTPDKRQIDAGGVVYRKCPDGQVEIFFIKDPYGRWTFPKGRREPGEAVTETAARETREEAGLDNLRLVSPLGRTSFRFKREEGVIETTVYLFLFEAAPNAEAKLTGEGGIWEGAWLKAHKAFNINGYRNLDALLAKAMRIICDEEGEEAIKHPLERRVGRSFRGRKMAVSRKPNN